MRLDRPGHTRLSLSERFLLLGVVAALLVACMFAGALAVEAW